MSKLITTNDNYPERALVAFSFDGDTNGVVVWAEGLELPKFIEDTSSSWLWDVGLNTVKGPEPEARGLWVWEGKASRDENAPVRPRVSFWGEWRKPRLDEFVRFL